ncbi:MAG: DUF1232 domain-containing protein [Treponema sp.]|nr:DUF1232 domain-containing protein [Treponema sp.]
MPQLTEKQRSRLQKIFDSFLHKSPTERDLDTVVKNEEKIKQKSVTGFLSQFSDEIFCLVDMVKAVARREYTGLSKSNLAAIVFTLIYVFSPLDVIPDVVPLAGLLDDAGMVGLCLKLISDAVSAYKKWAEKTGGLSHVIEEKALDSVQEVIEPEIRSFCVQAVVWSFVGLFCSLAGCVILFFKPFPAEVNDTVASMIFRVTLIFTILRLVILAIQNRKHISRFVQNWKGAKGEKNRIQKAIGRSIFIPVSANAVARFALEKLGGVKIQNDAITLDDIFVIKSKLPLGEINKKYPDLLSLAVQYARRLRFLFISTIAILVVNGALLIFIYATKNTLIH